LPGFLAFHIYLNAKVLPLYNGGQDTAQLLGNIFHSLSDDLLLFSVFLILLFSLGRLSLRETGFPWPGGRYHYFDLDSRPYTFGEILSIVGRGPSVEVTHGEPEPVHVCLRYGQANGEKISTIGCLGF
jgi:hypothetical protein